MKSYALEEPEAMRYKRVAILYAKWAWNCVSSGSLRDLAAHSKIVDNQLGIEFAPIDH